MKRASRRRGQPLVAFVVMLGGWTVARYAAWTFMGSDPFVHEPVAAGTPAPGNRAVIAKPALPIVKAAPIKFLPLESQDGSGRNEALPSVTPAPVELAPPLSAPPVVSPMPGTPQAAPIDKSQDAIATMGGHQLLWLSAFSKLPLPAEALPALAAHALRAAPIAKSATYRWSADGWVLLRRNTGPAGLAAIGGSYGASQAGAVLRYRIDTASAHKPSLYLRLTGALNGTREQDSALGFSARPIGKLPLVAMAEVRASRTPGGTHLRPAFALVTELPPVRLPLKLRAEAYGQAGWVGGANSTGFVDGQLRVDRKLITLGSSEVRAGGGAWGGAQKGASRLDIGPTANLSLRLSDTASARLSADWRFRISGRAAPSSGPALTLSAGF